LSENSSGTADVLSMDLSKYLKNRGERSSVSYTAYIPLELLEGSYLGKVYGYFVEDTGIFNITGTTPVAFNANVVDIGYIFDSPFETTHGLAGVRENGKLSFTYHGQPVTCIPYSLTREVYSRNTGILESDIMLHKRAVVVGCGSGGSFIALELAKAGVGKFVLIDNDIIEYHNIGRHVCSVYDVGKWKVDAVRERILSINPSSEVVIFRNLIEEIPESELSQYLDDNTLIMNCGDTRSSAHRSNAYSEKYNVPFIAAGAGVRASTGEVYYYLPKQGMPCYSCVVGEDMTIDTSNRVRRIAYADEIQEFQPGLSADINYIGIIAVKLAIDILMRNEEGYCLRLLPYLTQFTMIGNYVAATDAEKDPQHPNYNPLLQLFDTPLEIIHGVVEKREGCYFCKMIEERKFE